jgi:xanthine/uracil/vitamin C permease (AzgA family)
MCDAMDSFFHLSARSTTLTREVRVGVATFLTMGVGCVSYVAIAVCRARAVHPIVYGVGLAFGIFFWWA